MGHNVWTHIEAVQRANRLYDSGTCPDMMVHPHDPVYDARRVIERVFAAGDRSKSLAIIDEHSKIWERIVGTRGFTGKRVWSARPMFTSLFDFDQPQAEETDLDPAKLEELEESVDV
jgi:hypothetical protein